MTSLQDQLLNIGVVDKKKAKTSQHQKRQAANKNRKTIKSGKEIESNKMQQQLDKMAREKQQRDLALNKQRDAEYAKKALVAEVRQIVQQHAVESLNDADLAYNFSDDNRVKKIYITQEQQKQLTRGHLAIVIVGDQQYKLIPDKIAERIESALPELVIRTKSDENSNEDAPYADYQIPDDLMW